MTVLASVCVFAASASGDRWSDDKAEARRARVELWATALADRAARAERAQAEIAALFDKVVKDEVVIAEDDLWQLLAGLGRISA